MCLSEYYVCKPILELTRKGKGNKIKEIHFRMGKCEIKIRARPCQVAGASPCTPKSCRLNSRSGPIPSLRADPWEATNQCSSLTLMSLSLSLSPLPLSLRSIKICPQETI